MPAFAPVLNPEFPPDNPDCDAGLLELIDIADIDIFVDWLLVELGEADELTEPARIACKALGFG